MSYNLDEYFNSRDFKSIIRLFEEAENAGEQIILHPEEFVDLAEYYYNDGNFSKAMEIIEKVRDIYPEATAPLLFKARLALQEHNDVKTATLYADKIIDKEDIEYYYLKAEIMIVAGETEQADEYLERCLDKVDDEEKDFFAIDVAEIFLDHAITDIAEKWLERSEEKDSIEYEEQFARMKLKKREYETSKKLFNKLIDKDPYYTLYWNGLATSQIYASEFEESINSCEYSLAINPNDTNALLNKACALFDLDRYEESLETYQRYSRLRPYDEHCEIMIGICNNHIKDYEQSVVHLKKAEELATRNNRRTPKIYEELAYSLCCLGRIDEAMSVIDNAKSTLGGKLRVIFTKGETMLKIDKPRKAMSYLSTAIIESGESPEMIMNVAICFYDYGYFETSYNLFKILFESYQHWTLGYAQFAACCYELKRENEFLEALKIAVEYTPEETTQELGSLFPSGMKSSEYYQYMRQQLNK